MPLSDRTRARLPVLLWCSAYLTVAGLVQMAQPGWFDADTSFHLAVGRLIRQHGILHAFPWTSFSVMADRYADTELLLHLILAGLDGVVPGYAVGVAGTLLGALLLGTMMLVLRAEGVKRAGLWPLLALASSGAFCVRFALVRPHMLAVPLSLFITWAAVRRRLVLVFVGAVLYPFVHLGWISALGLVALAEIAHLVVSRRFDPRPVLAVVAGLATGLLVHPNFPAIVEHAWIEIAHTLFSAAWGGTGAIPIGGEFNPFVWKSALRFVALPGILAVAALASTLRRRPRDPATLTFALVACAFLLMTLKSQRFLETLAPFAVVAAALAFRDWRPRTVGGVLAAALVYTALVSQPLVAMVKSRPQPFSERAVAALDQAVPRDAQVFTCDWQLTGDMLLALPERRFMVALDPMLFYRKDRELFELWQRLVRQGPKQAAQTIRDRFGARFVLCEDNPAFFPLLRALLADPLATPRMRLAPLTLFELAPQGGGKRPAESR